MTNPSDALRVVVGKVSTVTDGDFLARLASGQQIACDCADFIREHGAALAQALAYMDATFDGYAVYNALTDRAKQRTFVDNINDTLDALSRVAKAAIAAQQKEEGK